MHTKRNKSTGVMLIDRPFKQLIFITLPILVYLTLGVSPTYGNPAPVLERIRILDTPRPINDAEIINQNGEPFKLSELHGKISLIFFGFTNCPDVCPVVMAKWRDLQRSDEIDSDQLNFVFISVDGERDTPEVLKRFLLDFSDKFIGLTSSPQKIKPIAKNFSAAFFKDNPSTNRESYNVHHSTHSFVLDQDGSLRAEIYNPPVTAMINYVEFLLNEKSITASDK